MVCILSELASRLAGVAQRKMVRGPSSLLGDTSCMPGSLWSVDQTIAYMRINAMLRSLSSCMSYGRRTPCRSGEMRKVSWVMPFVALAVRCLWPHAEPSLFLLSVRQPALCLQYNNTTVLRFAVRSVSCFLPTSIMAKNGRTGWGYIVAYGHR